MARSKTTTKSVSDSVVSVPVVSVPVVSAPVVTESSKKVSKAKTPVKPVVSVAPVVPLIEVSKEPVVENVCETDTAVAELSNDFVAKLQLLNSMISSLKSDYRALEKKMLRDLKTAQKQSSKRKKRSGTRAPSGFVKPTLISDELAKFLDKPSGSEMARTEVTRDINKYIRSNNLQDTSNGRKINPDVKLSTLLKLKKEDELTYFNLQRYMSPHFAKASKPIEVAST